MNYKMRSIVLFFLFLVTTTCKKEDDPIQKIYSDFQEYVDRFAMEGSLRGVNVDLRSLTAIYSDTLKWYCGYAAKNGISISLSPNCWKDQTDSNKEILFFHEMGHAVLNRSHDNSLLPNGDYKTMMLGGNQFDLYSEDSPERRKYYLDELFNSASQEPDWANQKLTATNILIDTIDKIKTNWKFVKRSGSTQIGEISSISSSPASGLSIRAISPSTFSYWSYELIPSGIKQSSKLILKLKIKQENITEGGVFVALRGDNKTKMTFFATTQGSKKILGTSDFAEFSLELPYYNDKTKKIYIFLIMDDKATGSAYFDDISLTSYE